MEIIKASEGFADKLKVNLYGRFSVDIKEEIINFLRVYYRYNLTDLHRDSKCKLVPENFEEEFFKRVNSFKYAYIDDDNVTLSLPDMENFNFKDGLEGLQTILEGTLGTYVEITAKEYRLLYDRDNPNVTTFNDLNTMVFTIEYNKTIQEKEEKVLGYKLPMYMFSNTPPFKMFESLDLFVDKNMDKWIDETINEVMKELE